MCPMITVIIISIFKPTYLQYEKKRKKGKKEVNSHNWERATK
jgi:hypothetical protein